MRSIPGLTAPSQCATFCAAETDTTRRQMISGTFRIQADVDEKTKTIISTFLTETLPLRNDEAATKLAAAAKGVSLIHVHPYSATVNGLSATHGPLFKVALRHDGKQSVDGSLFFIQILPNTVKLYEIHIQQKTP